MLLEMIFTRVEVRNKEKKSANFETKKMFYKTEKFIVTERKDSSSDQTVY